MLDHFLSKTILIERASRDTACATSLLITLGMTAQERFGFVMTFTTEASNSQILPGNCAPVLAMLEIATLSQCLPQLSQSAVQHATYAHGMHF